MRAQLTALFLLVAAACPALKAQSDAQTAASRPTSLHTAPGATADEAAALTGGADLIVVGERPEPRYAILDRAGRGPAILTHFDIRVSDVLLGWPAQAGVEVQSRDAGWTLTVVPYSQHARNDTDAAALPPPGAPQPYVYFLRIAGIASLGETRVEPVRPEMWFAVATEDVLRAARAALPTPPPPREFAAPTGLELCAVPRNAKFKVGQAILIDLYIVNRGSKTWCVPQHRSAGGYRWTYADGYARTAGPRTLSMHFFRPPRVLNDPPHRPLIQLAPGAWFRETVRLDSWSWYADVEAPLQPGGGWGGTFHYSTDDLHDAVPPGWACAGEALFIGHLQSNPIGIEIVPSAP